MKERRAHHGRLGLLTPPPRVAIPVLGASPCAIRTRTADGKGQGPLHVSPSGAELGVRHTLLLFHEHESTSGRDREPSVSTFVTVYGLGKERGKEALTMNRVPEGGARTRCASVRVACDSQDLTVCLPAGTGHSLGTDCDVIHEEVQSTSRTLSPQRKRKRTLACAPAGWHRT